MKKVYDLVPYRLTRTFVPQCEAKRCIKLRADIHNRFIDELNQANVRFAMSGHLFTIFGQGMFSLEIGRCVTTEYTKSLRWSVHSRPEDHNCPCLVIRMEPDNATVRDCCLLPRVAQFKVRFSLSDEVLRRTAIIHNTSAEMVRFIAGREEHWLENWVAASTQVT